MSDEKGGGSLTALPVIEILEGDVSTFVPTNVISITDGQILLKPELFYAGNRPAMDVGASVSRVGSAAQTKAMKAVARTIKGDISRYNEVKAFAQFGTSDLDQSTRNLLNRGEKLMEILKQGQYSPLPLEEETVALAAIEYVLEFPTADVRRFEQELLQYMRDRQPEILAAIRDSGNLSDETKEKMNAALDTFRGTFKPSAG
jgi:F-type H+-transporting ATPase subunit alpha